MDIQVTVNNPQKAIALLEVLKSIDVIDDFTIIGNDSPELLTLENESDLSIAKK